MRRRRKRKQLGGLVNHYMSGTRPPPIFGGYKWDRYGNMVSIHRRQRGGLYKWKNKRKK